MATKQGINTGKSFIEVYKDENGVFRYGDMVIPQKRYIAFTGTTKSITPTRTSESDYLELVPISGVNAADIINKKLEVTAHIVANGYSMVAAVKGVAIAATGGNIVLWSFNNGDLIVRCGLYYDTGITNTAGLIVSAISNSVNSVSVSVNSVCEVIE